MRLLATTVQYSCSCALALQLVPAAAAPPSPRRNVLYIVYDDLRPDLSVYNLSFMRSPNLQKLADTGVTFDRAYCQQTVCAPSRMSFTSGRRPNSTRTWNFLNHFRQAECQTERGTVLLGTPLNATPPATWGCDGCRVPFASSWAPKRGGRKHSLSSSRKRCAEPERGGETAYLSERIIQNKCSGSGNFCVRPDPHTPGPRLRTEADGASTPRARQRSTLAARASPPHRGRSAMSSPGSQEVRCPRTCQLTIPVSAPERGAQAPSAALPVGAMYQHL